MSKHNRERRKARKLAKAAQQPRKKPPAITGTAAKNAARGKGWSHSW